MKIYSNYLPNFVDMDFEKTYNGNYIFVAAGSSCSCTSSCLCSSCSSSSSAATVNK